MADKTFHSIKFPGLPDTYKIPDIVNEYSTSSAYAVGDYVLKDGKTYKCTTAIASSGEAWNGAHWTEVKVGNDLKGQVADLKSASILFRGFPTKNSYSSLAHIVLPGVYWIGSSTNFDDAPAQANARLIVVQQNDASVMQFYLYMNGNKYNLMFRSVVSETFTPVTSWLSLVEIDPTLTLEGKAADAKATGDEIADLKSDLKKKAGLSEEAKSALLDCFEHVAWIDKHSQTYYDSLYDALYPETQASALVYKLPSGTDISTHAIDTDVPVFGADDDFTILIKAHMVGLPSDNTTKYLMNHGFLSSGTLRLGVIRNNNVLSYISNVMYGDNTTDITITGETYESDIMYVVRIENKIATKMLYVDGERLVNKTEDISSYLSSKVFTGDYMISAFNNASATDGLFPGIVKLLRIYNKALQDSDIESIVGIQM